MVGSDGEGWCTEVVALLEESKESVLGGGGAQGGQIVGSSLGQVKSPEAKELFDAMAALAEDVPAPMSALALVWCASKGIEPPLGRFALMKLRRWCFELLDRNLAIGNTSSGVFMHDVVRDYCQRSADGAALIQRQRLLVRFLLEAAPTGGWRLESLRKDALSNFVAQQLRVEGIAGATPDDDVEVLTWLHAKMPQWFLTFSVQEAAEAIGHEALLRMAETAEARGDYLTAARRYGQLALTNYGATHWGSLMLGTPVTDDHPMLQASRCWFKVEDDTPYVRTEELWHQLFVNRYIGILEQRSGPSFVRTGELLNRGGLEETVLPSDTMLVALGCTWPGLLACGFFISQTAGNHLKEANMRMWMTSWGKTTTLSLQAVTAMQFADDDPQWAVQLNRGHFSHLCCNGSVYAFPDLLDPGLLHPAPELTRFVAQYDLRKHHRTVVATDAVGIDTFLNFHPAPLSLIRYGRIDIARAGLKLHAEAHEMFETDGFEVPYDKYPSGFMTIVPTAGPTITVAAGLRRELVEQVHLGRVTYAEVDDPDWDYLLRPVISWRHESSAGTLTFGSRELMVGGHKLRHFFLAPDEVGHGVVAAWLDHIPPGEACNIGHGSDICSSGAFHCVIMSVEPEVRLLLGQVEPARKAAEVLTSRGPFNMILRLTCAAVEAAALTALGQRDNSAQLLRRTAQTAREHSAHFVALMMSMDLHDLAAEGGEGPSKPLQQDALVLVGRAVLALDRDAVDGLRCVLAARGIDLDEASGAAAAAVM